MYCRLRHMTNMLPPTYWRDSDMSLQQKVNALESTMNPTFPDALELTLTRVTRGRAILIITYKRN